MRRNLNGLIIMALVLLMSGCGGNAENVMVSMPTAAEVQKLTEAATPTETIVTAAPETPELGTAAPQPTEKQNETQQPEILIIEGAKIYKQSDEGNKLKYDAAAYFPEGWNCTVAHLQAEDGVLYFTEGGMPGDGSGNEEDSKYRVIRVDSHGRTVIQEDSVIGYMQLVLYGDKIFIVQDGFDSQNIRWAYKNGNSAKDLDFSKYAAQYDVEPYYNSATLHMKDDGKLYADIAFYTDGDPEIADHTVSISEDLKITRVK